MDILPRDMLLTVETRGALLALARRTIVRHLAGEKHQDPATFVDFDTLPVQAAYRAGAFVTLKYQGNLRGCIGIIQPDQPLWEAVVVNAISAAAKDFRFPAVTADEVGEIQIEISVLAPPREVDGPEQFQVGPHGILIEKQGRRAVFLPQVAPEQGWDREQTFAQLCLKAGLPEDAWREGARFWVFEAQVFGERR